MIHEIAAISNNSNVESMAPSQQPSFDSFGEMLNEKIESTNYKINNAELMIHQISQGQDVEMHDAMLAMQQAKIELSLVVEVRNKLLEAYQEVMRMQV